MKFSQSFDFTIFSHFWDPVCSGQSLFETISLQYFCSKKISADHDFLVDFINQRKKVVIFLTVTVWGIQQTLQKKSVGFIPWDGITIGKDGIP